MELSPTPLKPIKIPSQKLMTARDPTDHVAMIIKILGMPTRISGNLSSENKEEENGNSHVKP